jgi:hypothetical protein
LAFAGVAVATPAYGQPAAAAPEATRFEFRAPAGCSSAEDFAARVSKRSWRIKLSPDAGVRRSLVVEIQQAPAGGTLRGTVTVVEADGATRKRQLKAASCEEAVDALSLIATVTLDPDAMLGEAPPEETPDPVPQSPAVSKPAPPRNPPPRFRRTAPTEPYRFSFGLAAALLLEMAPEPALGGTASAAFEINPGNLLSPFWRLSLTHAQRRDIAERGGLASFAFTLPTLDACPVRFGPRVFALRPCAYGSLGLLKVWGDGTLQNETHSRLYGAAGLAALLSVRISEAFEIIADARAGLPFYRDQFAFDRGSAGDAGDVFFKTPTPGFSIGLGAAGGFP